VIYLGLRARRSGGLGQLGGRFKWTEHILALMHGISYFCTLLIRATRILTCIHRPIITAASDSVILMAQIDRSDLLACDVTRSTFAYPQRLTTIMASFPWLRFTGASVGLMTIGYVLMKATTPTEEQLYNAMAPDLRRKVDAARATRLAREAEAKKQLSAQAANEANPEAAQPIWADTPPPRSK